MNHESGSRRAPHSGKLRARPLALLLAQACDRCVTGTLTVAHAGQRATILLRAGRILSVRASTPGPFLGSVVADLGFSDPQTIDRAFLSARAARKLHGEVLITEGAISAEELDIALAEQTRRKVAVLFELPDETTFASREDAELVTDARDGNRPPIEPWALIWHGMRTREPNEHVQRAIARLDGTIAIVNGPQLDRLGLDADELAFCKEIETANASASRIIATSRLGERRTEMLLYCLLLAHALEAKPVKVDGPRDLGRDGVRALAGELDASPHDPWTTLGLRRGASVEAARAAFLRLSRVWRPDRLPHDLVDLASECERIYRAMSDAHRKIVEEGARHLSLVPAPIDATPEGRATMRDIDAALGRNDLQAASELARTLRNAGAEGPRARAIMAWCEAGGDEASTKSAEDAIAALDRILAGDPECIRALVYRARFNERLKRLDAARADLRKALRIDPTNSDAQLGLRVIALQTFGDDSAEGARQRSCRPTLPSSGLHPYLVRAK